MSKIASIEVRALAPDVERFRYTAIQDEVFTTTTLVSIEDQDGASGIGAYDSDSYGDWDRAPLETLRTLVPTLVAMDALDHDAVAAAAHRGRLLAVPARGALDDRHRALGPGRARGGPPLHVALGGDPASTSLPSYASVALMDDEAAYLEAIEGWVERGFSADQAARVGRPRARCLPASRPSEDASTRSR